jgi:Spy/CpxP family protein refolding chaperone
MRTLSIVFALAVAIAVYPKSVGADEPRSERRERAAERMAERLADLNLTDEQETKIKDVRKECKPKIQEAAKELASLVKDEVDKVREILTPEQKEKAKAITEERKENRSEHLAARLAHVRDLELSDAEKAQFEEIREEYRPKLRQLMDQLAAVLTDEQKKTREEGLKAGKTRREIRESLNLSSEQKEKLESIGKELVSVVRDELEKMKSVLNTAQQEKLPELKIERRDRARDRLASAIANFKDLDLTDDQKSKIAAIREEYRPKVHEAGNKLRAAVRDEVSQILEIVKS